MTKKFYSSFMSISLPCDSCLCFLALHHIAFASRELGTLLISGCKVSYIMPFRWRERSLTYGCWYCSFSVLSNLILVKSLLLFFPSMLTPTLSSEKNLGECHVYDSSLKSSL